MNEKLTQVDIFETLLKKYSLEDIEDLAHHIISDRAMKEFSMIFCVNTYSQLFVEILLFIEDVDRTRILNVLSEEFKKLPLHVNDKDNTVKAIVNWRLSRNI